MIATALHLHLHLHLPNIMSKQKLLRNLREDTYCRLDASRIHGVGVFAIKDIPKGTNPFERLGNIPRPVGLTDAEVNSLPSGVKKMIHDYSEKCDKWYVPDVGMNGLDITFYLNHSSKPNMIQVDAGDSDCMFVIFRTIKHIKKGEELFINYNK